MERLLLLAGLFFTLEVISQVPTTGLFAFYPFNVNCINSSDLENDEYQQGAPINLTALINPMHRFF